MRAGRWCPRSRRSARRTAPRTSPARGGDWFIDRTTTLLPFCNYYNEIGIYSMRSYTLQRQVAKEQVQICKAAPGGASVAVAPYAGPCPPK